MVLAVALTYLSCIHLYRQTHDYGSYTLDISGNSLLPFVRECCHYRWWMSGPLMIITQKVTSLAFSIHDGIARAESELTNSQKLYAVRKIPSALEYFSFALQFPTIMAGPAMFYKDYVDFIDGKHLLQSSSTVSGLFKRFPLVY